MNYAEIITVSYTYISIIMKSLIVILIVTSLYNLSALRIVLQPIAHFLIAKFLEEYFIRAIT